MSTKLISPHFKLWLHLLSDVCFDHYKHLSSIKQTVPNVEENAKFLTPIGGGNELSTKLSAGMHFFVCRPNTSMGMKGKIIVQIATDLADNQTAKFFNLRKSNKRIIRYKSK